MGLTPLYRREIIARRFVTNEAALSRWLSERLVARWAWVFFSFLRTDCRSAYGAVDRWTGRRELYSSYFGFWETMRIGQEKQRPAVFSFFTVYIEWCAVVEKIFSEALS